jgi:NADH dehydrogenase FAD-containing subunit
LEFQRGTATKITDTHVHLETPAGGHESVEWDYLAIATGAAQPAPARVFSPDRAGACAELRAVQTLIAHARSVAIVGAGAVGVELAADIKSFHPDKEVTLIHSRTRVLNQFGERLHAYVVAFLERELGVRVVLGERPVLPVGGACDSVMEGGVLVFSDGREERFDLIVCVSSRVSIQGNGFSSWRVVRTTQGPSS